MPQVALKVKAAAMGASALVALREAAAAHRAAHRVADRADPLWREADALSSSLA